MGKRKAPPICGGRSIQREVAPTDVSVAIDISNAFNMLERPLFFEALSSFRKGLESERDLRRYDTFSSYAHAHYLHGPQDLSFFMADGKRKSLSFSYTTQERRGRRFETNSDPLGKLNCKINDNDKRCHIRRLLINLYHLLIGCI